MEIIPKSPKHVFPVVIVGLFAILSCTSSTEFSDIFSDDLSIAEAEIVQAKDVTTFTLDSTKGKTEKVISFGESNVDTRYFVDVIDDGDGPRKDLRLHVTLLSMTCNNFDNDNETRLNVAYSNSLQNVEKNWCTNLTRNTSIEANTSFIVSGQNQFEFEAVGDWSSSNAQIVVTVYYEVGSCKNCEGRGFCCKLSEQFNRRICIDGLLTCNGRPNCGSDFNEDELEESCYCAGYFGYQCDWSYWKLMWMTSMAVTFFILIPGVVLFLYCYNKELSRARLFRPHPDPTVNQRRRARRGDGVTVHSRPGDLPPTYDDVHQTKEPPPCFCTVAVVSEGNDNPGFVPDNRVEDQSVSRKCFCGKPVVAATNP